MCQLCAVTNTGVVMTFGVKLLGAAESKYSILAVLQNTGDPECIAVKLCNQTDQQDGSSPQHRAFPRRWRPTGLHRRPVEPPRCRSPPCPRHSSVRRRSAGTLRGGISHWLSTFLVWLTKTDTDPEFEHPAHTGRDAPKRGPGPKRQHTGAGAPY